MPNSVSSSAVTSFHVYIDPTTGIQIGRVKNASNPTQYVFNGITNPIILTIPVATFLTLTAQTIDAQIIAIGAAQGMTVQPNISPLPLINNPVPVSSQHKPPTSGNAV